MCTNQRSTSAAGTASCKSVQLSGVATGRAGRVDDVINVSGHRIGTAEVEGALTQHPQCAEAAVVPMEHPIKGQGIYAYVTLMVVRPSPPVLSRPSVIVPTRLSCPIQLSLRGPGSIPQHSGNPKAASCVPSVMAAML